MRCSTLERDYNAARDRGRAGAVLAGDRQGGGWPLRDRHGRVRSLLKGGAYFSPERRRVVDVMDRFRGAIDRGKRSDPFLREHPARLEFLHHDDSTRQPPDIAIAREMGEVLRERGGDGAAARRRSAATCVTS